VVENHTVPKHYFCGPRILNIILTQLRSSASFLNYDLFRVGTVSDKSCRCGAALESLKYFVLDCPIYLSQNYPDRESQHGYNLLFSRYQISDMWKCKFNL
jgi:hypothetical protein